MTKREQIFSAARPRQGPQADPSPGCPGEGRDNTSGDQDPTSISTREQGGAGRACWAGGCRRRPRSGLAQRSAQRGRDRAQGAGRAVRVADRLDRRRCLHVPRVGLRLHRHGACGPGGDDGRRLQHHHRLALADPDPRVDDAPDRRRAQPGHAGAAADVTRARLGARGRKVARGFRLLLASPCHDPRVRGLVGHLRARKDDPRGRGCIHPCRRSRFRPDHLHLHRDAAGRRRVGCHRRSRVGPDEEPDHRLRRDAAWAPGDLVHRVPHRLLHDTAAEPVLRLCGRLLPLPAVQPGPGDRSGHRVLRQPGGGRDLPDDQAARVTAVAVNRWARRARAGSLSLVLTLVVVALLVGANLLASKSTAAVDLTRGGLNTLAPQSVLAVKRLTADLQVVGLFRAAAGNGQTETEALIGLYGAQSSHVKYRREDYNSDSADIKRYAVKEPNTVVLDYKGKTELLAQGSQGEVDFTAALLKLESDRVPLVCWAIGDGERDLKDTNQSTGYSSVADTLAKNNFATRDVLLSQVTSIPSDCALVAIVDPTTELAAPSVKAVADYLSAGGKLLVTAEPWAKDAKSIDSLNAVLTPYGVGFSGALVIETDPSRRSSSDPTILAVTTYGRSPITNDIQGHVSFFPLATAITGVTAAGVTASPIATSSSTSYAIAQPRSVQDLARKAGDASGPFNVMETLEQNAGSSRTRIVIVGTAGFAENRTMPPTNNDANLELALASFQWLAEQDSLISIPPKAGRALPLALTQQDQSILIFVTTVLMPALIVFGGVMVWWRRRVFS